ncbi:OmpL47-type beta-barrel domain-containing protein [Dyadobacter sandarakinus]|uniref:Ig-like domain-containing protein n=1 Tax=Dyadobacter sandarakinus TaxID=2747268 RepID=A0ABX7I0B7_9BACT|nr:Ig-like domain-containing protein [Dyadobacter sandarakinus]QRQ99446.1 Ig-like domain-containing protein [Dyadobacter sandarakinus]
MIKNYISNDNPMAGIFARTCLFLSFLMSLASPGEALSVTQPASRTLADGCVPVSPLACSATYAAYPFALSFDAGVPATVTDKAGNGTGFLTINSLSGTRTSEDGQPTIPSLPGYEPSKITLTGGRLQIVASKGIDYLANNNQINVLGVKVRTGKKIQLDVQLINPVNAAQAQQGGLWFGLHDKTFIKLGVTGNKVELRKELNDVSSNISGLANPDQRRTETITGLNTKTVSLRMVIDSAANTVEGFYSTDGTNYVSTGALYAVPVLDIAGTGLTQGDRFAGVFATYRNGSAPVTYTFDNFAIDDLIKPDPLPREFKVSFQPQSATIPAGYTADYGNAFDAAKGYGWMNAATREPGDYTGNTRVRTGSGDPRQLSLIQMQAASDNTTPGAWEHDIENGIYTVTVSVGDNGYYNSTHQLNVEGLPAITDFTPTSSNRFRTAIATVRVTDKKLTINANGGIGTKLNYIDVAPAAPVADSAAPVAGARFEGTLKAANVYSEQVKVILSAADAGSSGLNLFQYAINNGQYVNYTGPFILNTGGDYTLKVRAADANGNETITSNYEFSIFKQPVVTRFSFQPAGTPVPSGYVADLGNAFDETRGYGWLSADTKVPGDYTGNTRVRTGSGDSKQLSLLQMQATTDNIVPGAWEHVVENGTYTVTVSAGDFKYFDSNHQINVEGLPAISDFNPSSTTKFRAATATVQVTDGRLTIDATGGRGTKINYINFSRYVPVADTLPPVASARFEGTIKSGNVYDQQVRVILTATDAGQAGLAALQYSLNNGDYIRYTSPFVIDARGSYSLKVRAADANNNEVVSSPYLFGVFREPDSKTVKISFRPQGNAVPEGFTADNGKAYEPLKGSGWINSSTKAPLDFSTNVLIRNGADQPLQLSFAQMQADTTPAAWEYAVQNGTYKVIVSAGDAENLGSNHQINVEGLPAISDFRPDNDHKFRYGVVSVPVTDGKLTIDAANGVNTKINYIIFTPAETVADTLAPVISARFEGESDSASVYKHQVKIFLTATDEGASGLAEFQYSINNGSFVNYTGPVLIQTPGNYTIKLRAADATPNERVTQNIAFSIVDPVEVISMTFSKPVLNFTVIKGQQVLPQTVEVLATPAVNAFTLSKTEASWLTLPANTSGKLEFGPANINSNLDEGSYQALVTCQADGHEPTTLLVNLHVVNALNPAVAKINFQDAASGPPLNYFRDFGQAFGARTAREQGAGLQFGWKKRSDGTPLDLTANGRNRNTPEDVLLATLIHMQANQITSTFKGTKVEGYWEMKVPNGTYEVQVSAGDGDIGTSAESHTLNVEGVTLISNFVPNGKTGTISRFKSATGQVHVTDELLTVNADGGTNTKINYINVFPVTLDPYLYWATRNANIIIKKETTVQNTISVVLGSSNNSATAYNLSAVYGAGATGWLTFEPSPSGTQPNVSINYTAAKDLPLGIYHATIRASSGGLTSAELQIQLNVVEEEKPYVISSNPINGATKVGLNTVSVAANNLHVPAVPGYQGGVNNATITESTVKLVKVVDNIETPVKGVVQGTGGGDVISFSPSASLEAHTVYKFIITSGVKSYSGAGFAPYEATFTTDAAAVDTSGFLNATFTKVPVPGTQNKKYTSLTFGPDGNFYALRLDGVIEKYTVNPADGSLENQRLINTLVHKYGSRTAIGLTFEPGATPQNMVAWVTHSSAGLTSAPTFDGNVSKLSGDSLQYEQLIVTKLPRSKRDHLTNSMAFGPDGALYINQGSNSSAGSYDSDWQRDESLLSGSVLRLDLVKLAAFALPINVQTTTNQALINKAPVDSAIFRDGTYNPYGSNAPLTIFASGVRNAYDLVWHSNGQLYLPTNGSGGGGNSPESVAGTRRPDGSVYNGPAIPATNGIKAQNDWLFRVNPNKPVGYYGHPNPMRGEYVLNRGFPDNALYLPSVKPDVNYRIGYNFGLNNSPNGAIEYKSNNFGGVLKNKLLVCRFSGGGDIIVMEPGARVPMNVTENDSLYDIVKVNTGSSNTGLNGMSGFGNPLDITEDVKTGNLYVIEYNWNDSPNLTSQITLLRAQGNPAPAPALAVQMTSSGETASGASQRTRTYSVQVSNKGNARLEIKQVDLSGKDAAAFRIADLDAPSEDRPLVLEPGDSLTFQVLASVRSDRSSSARLHVVSMDNTAKDVEINNVPERYLSNLPAEKAGESGLPDHTLRLFPNPSAGTEPVTLKLENFSKMEPVTVYMYDMQGNVIQSISERTDMNGELNIRVEPKRGTNQNSFIIKVAYPAGFRFVKWVNIP